MNLFKEHRQLWFDLALVCVLALILVFGVYVNAVPAEQSPDTQMAADNAGGGTDADRSAYDNCLALQNLDLVDWDNDGIVYEDRLQTVACNAEGLAFALRLQNLEKDVFTAKYAPPDTAEYPDWAEYYIGYAVHENMVETDFDGTAELDGALYVDWLLKALDKQGFAADAEDFADYIDGKLTYERLGDLTYQALCLTKEQDGSETSLADCLIEQDIIDADAAVLADLPVAANTAANYKRLFIQSLQDKAVGFDYTAKNKALMLELMNDPTSLFVLVNQENTLQPDFVPELTGGGKTDMNPTAAKALDVMLTDAAADGMTLRKQSGYRSYERQRQLYGDGDNVYRAAPGASEHQTGLAMDLVNAAGVLDDKLCNSIEAKWLAANCWRYGFIIRYTSEKADITGYPAEWWHVRYVGKTIACEIHQTGMAYEEFYQKCQSGARTAAAEQ